MTIKFDFRKIVLSIGLVLVAFLLVRLIFGAVKNFSSISPETSITDSLTMEKLTTGVDGDVSQLEKVVVQVPGQSTGCYWNVNLTKMKEIDNVAEMYDVDAHYFNADGVELYQLTSVSGETYWDTGKMHFHENVKFKTLTGRRLSSDDLYWDPQKGITAVGNVLAEYEETTVTTEKLTSNADMDQSQFYGETHVVSQGREE